MYPDIEPPRISVIKQVKKNPRVVRLANPGKVGMLYYTIDGRDPRERGGRPAAGALSRNADLGDAVLRLTKPTTIKARIKKGEEWSALLEAAL
jgi:hypothetical protein